MTHIIESLLAKTTRGVLTKKPSRQKCGLSSKADRTIKYCTRCCKCWEPEYTTTRMKSKSMILYYTDFPKFKKPREECPKCVDLQNKNV